MAGQRVRLGWLAAAAAYTGSLCRKVFAERFRLGAAQVSRDIQAFTDAAQEKGFKLRVRHHGTLDASSMIPDAPILLPAPEPSTILADVLGDAYVTVIVEEQVRPHAPTVRAVVRAITENRGITFVYASTTSELRRRHAFPHAVVHADGRLHVRAYDTSVGYRDFILSRMRNVVLGTVAGDPKAARRNDIAWHRTAQIVLTIRHPDHSIASILAAEIGADPITLTRRIEVREALLDYALPLYRGGRYARPHDILISVERSTGHPGRSDRSA